MLIAQGSCSHAVSGILKSRGDPTPRVQVLIHLVIRLVMGADTSGVVSAEHPSGTCPELNTVPKRDICKGERITICTIKQGSVL